MGPIHGDWQKGFFFTEYKAIVGSLLYKMKTLFLGGFVSQDTIIINHFIIRWHATYKRCLSKIRIFGKLIFVELADMVISINMSSKVEKNCKFVSLLQVLEKRMFMLLTVL